jgi:23S rRNA pseudouridine2457 synthase
MSRNVPVEPPRILLFHKPYGVLCQFTDGAGRATLADYVREPGLYAAGRLDADSEGLLVLTSTAWVKARLTDPAHETPKTYWAQVEVLPDVDIEAALERLREGVELADGPTRPARARRLDPEATGGAHVAPGLKGLPHRDPPIRPRPGRETAWIEITITEGRNRQVRRMAAAVGLPTLRLVRVAVGPWRLDGLASGAVRRVDGIPAALFRRARRG